ncbi:TPA: amidohydrolase [Klebsiella pneumoniae]|uniref:M20 aminoacylase family protein n=1 Tax=Klebsiella pneumoniae complex TaxID=3390273 RepID=UPI00064A5D17|nr:M20 aminoacylase family protein [Klebsiella pneumoniae]MDU7325033.1 M20 aminoacylase family protein [Klebsiella michiganensis]MDU7867365.1 M20 aminoacylase family protein [Pantoea sp.]AKL27229.1 peptidase M20 [Klebsiella pneumoniae]ALR28631.1 peptidase M20 [Klebsiella pneumoniae]KMI23428.1 hippurate hydrolase [Klebsiella pneumoniae]
MPILQHLIAEAIAWRHEFHANPELGYEEFATSQRVAELLTSFGLQVHTGLGGTGIVATLENGQGPTIGLRADMDALPITELGEASYKSRNKGVMHACGHDGHTAILLAAAKHLSETRNFSGTVHFVFQPAEENLGGAYKMVADGLFERFPMDGIYALHNWPGLPVGHVGLSSGAMMASLDSFEITITGKSCHAAMPENGSDPIIAASLLIQSLQTIAARRLSPQSSAVVSITQISGGEAINVIPEKVTLRGTMRCLQTDVRIKVKDLINEFVNELPRVFGVRGEITYYPGYPVTMNHEQEALNVREAVSSIFGESKLHWQINPSMASEDFACMLEACPGAYLWLGSDGVEPSKPLHNAYYDFNDELIKPGVELWTSLVERLLLKS